MAGRYYKFPRISQKNILYEADFGENDMKICRVYTGYVDVPFCDISTCESLQAYPHLEQIQGQKTRLYVHAGS